MCRTHQKWKTVTSIIIDEFNVVHHPSNPHTHIHTFIHPIFCLYVVYLIQYKVILYWNIIFCGFRLRIMFCLCGYIGCVYFVWWVCYYWYCILDGRGGLLLLLFFSFNFILLKYVVWSLNDFVALQYIQHTDMTSEIFVLFLLCYTKVFNQKLEKGYWILCCYTVQFIASYNEYGLWVPIFYFI